jgi:hypothetical protein
VTTVEKKVKKKADDEYQDNLDLATEAPALPPPQPGEPGYDWQQEYPGEKVFTYTHDDVTVGFAAISKKRQPTIGFLMDARKQPEFEQVLDMVEFITCPAALAIVREWVPTDLIGAFEAWSEWNRTNAGE